MFHKGLFAANQGRSSEDMSLNITSMADIFTIILVFLLKSFSSGALQVTPSQGTTLPVARAPASAVEALKVEVSANGVTVEGKPAVSLSDFQFPRGDLATNLSSQQLGRVLERERKRQLLLAQGNPGVKVDSKVLIIADQKTPYGTLKSVLASAALQGFTDFKLAVIQPE